MLVHLDVWQDPGRLECRRRESCLVHHRGRHVLMRSWTPWKRGAEVISGWLER
jgi:hypothetical protein